MTRDEFADKLARKGGITQYEARRLTNVIFDGETGIVARELARGGSINFAGFGVLSTKVLPARTCRNPQSGENFTAPAKRVVRFKAGRNMAGKIANTRIPAGAKVLPDTEE